MGGDKIKKGKESTGKEKGVGGGLMKKRLIKFSKVKCGGDGPNEKQVNKVQ